jgi:hypothetical protein
MATSSVKELTGWSSAIEAETLRFIRDLQPLENVLKSNDQTMFVTFTENGALNVYAPAQYRAYVPKSYGSHKVNFVDWRGDDIQFDLSEEIYT